MKSHPIELSLIANVYDKNGKLIKTYTEPKKQEGKDYIEFIIRDDKGNIKDVKYIPMRSFVRNFLRNLNLVLASSAGGAFVKTNGSFYNVVGSQNINQTFRTNAGAGNSLYGIIIGTGSNSVTSSNFILNYELPTSMVSYGTTFFESSSEYGNGYKFTIKRIFNNITENDINIRETGLYFYHTSQGQINPITDYAMMARDVIDSSSNAIDINLSASQNLEVKYNIFMDGTSGLTRNFIYALDGLISSRNQNIPLKTIHYNGTSILEKNTNFSDSAINRFFIISSPYGSSSYGIVVGSGSATASLLDYKLEHHYEHGTNTNQLIYDTVFFSESFAVSSSTTFQKRNFINNSGGELTIREAALYSWGTASLPSQPLSNPTMSAVTCIARKLTGELILQDQQSVEIQFVFNTST